jgi:hypothetical protein
MRLPAGYFGLLLLLAGCSALPEVLHQPQVHNPFPQLHRIAVLPFYNQSAEPTVDAERVALAYYNELQQIPGFEVLPLGVARYQMEALGVEPRSGADFQQLAQLLGVDAVVVGSITEYSPYYPPRLGLAVRWYAANPGFHPVPPGYGLPWGTAEEEFIPQELVFEAEFALARAQLATQTPLSPAAVRSEIRDRAPAQPEAESLPAPAPRTPVTPTSSITRPAEAATSPAPSPAPLPAADPADGLPPDWPDPRGFVPPQPSASRPAWTAQPEAVLSLTRLYHGNDSQFTERLAAYYQFRDEARFGGWQAYLQRSDDFIRFCCHLHITELLAARGGAGETRVVWRWPIGRYER